MAYSIKDYKFETEAEAATFANSMRTVKNVDTYVMGPVYMDDEEIFKNVIWCTSKEKWWQVTVSYY